MLSIPPAVTWPHKNHLRLLEALVHLRDSGLAVQLVCTGARFDPFLQGAANELRALKSPRRVLIALPSSRKVTEDRSGCLLGVSGRGPS